MWLNANGKVHFMHSHHLVGVVLNGSPTVLYMSLFGVLIHYTVSDDVLPVDHGRYHKYSL